MRINLAQTKLMKRYLVYTTDDSTTRSIDPTRFFASAIPENSRFSPPVEKDGLNNSQDVPAAIVSIWTALREDRITPDEANALSGVADRSIQAIELKDMMRRIENLELQATHGRNDFAFEVGFAGCDHATHGVRLE